MNIKQCCIIFVGTLGMVSNAFAGDPRDVVPDLQKWASHPLVVNAVKEQNNKKVKLKDIKQIDKEWREKKGDLPLKDQLMTNAAAKELAGREKEKPYFVESILTDNRGANVAITAVTSDYWQGDEVKFSKSFNKGKGGSYVGRIKRDKSTGERLSQVSVSVMDGNVAIGTLTVGVRVDKIGTGTK